MFRFISVLLILLGVAAMAFGAVQYFEAQKQPEALSVAPGASTVPAATPPPSTTRRATPVPTLEGDDEISVTITSAGSEMMSRLRTVPIAHEIPTSAKFGRPFDVTVAIDATGDSTAADALPGRGTIVEGTAQVSATVMAALSGDTFDIEAVTPMTQTVSPLTENVWRWRVTPTATGPQDLVIELFALEGDQALPVRTFRDKVEVQVSRIGQFVSIAKSISPLVVVFGGIGSFLGGLFGAFRFFRPG